MKLDLPTPGRAGQPDAQRRPRRGAEPRPRSARAAARWSARVNSTRVIARASARRSPAASPAASQHRAASSSRKRQRPLSALPLGLRPPLWHTRGGLSPPFCLRGRRDAEVVRSIFRSLAARRGARRRRGPGRRPTEASFDFSIAGHPRRHAGPRGRADSGNSYGATAPHRHRGRRRHVRRLLLRRQRHGHGSSGDGKVVPLRYTATSKSPRALRHSRIEWKDGTPVKVSVEPPRSTRARSRRSRRGRSTRSRPASGCSATRRRRRSATPTSMSSTARGSRGWSSTPPVADGDRLTCAGRYARVEGEAEQHRRPARVPVQRRLPPQCRRRWRQLQRIEAPTNFGTGGDQAPRLTAGRGRRCRSSRSCRRSVRRCAPPAGPCCRRRRAPARPPGCRCSCSRPGLVAGRIVMLEPRRVAARAAAERLAQALGEPVGRRVGYRMRGEAVAGARIEVVTEGILTRMIQAAPGPAGHRLPDLRRVPRARAAGRPRAGAGARGPRRAAAGSVASGDVGDARRRAGRGADGRRAGADRRGPRLAGRDALARPALVRRAGQGRALRGGGGGADAARAGRDRGRGAGVPARPGGDRPDRRTPRAAAAARRS